MPSDLASKLVTICRRAVLGEFSVIEASRLICALCHDPDPDFEDSDLNLFRTIYDETEHLPVGKFRDNWAREALERKDAEIAEVESFYKEAAAASYRALLDRYDKTVYQALAADAIYVWVGKRGISAAQLKYKSVIQLFKPT